MTIGISLCSSCKHFHFKDWGKNACDAYPNGIPAEVFMLEVDHRKPYKGDHGIQFEPGKNAYEKYSSYQIMLKIDKGLPLDADVQEKPPAAKRPKRTKKKGRP